ncbi:MAG: 50S ribosomal protein L4 [candidate division Zixibacteria bacterium]|nr:50S ribosomal protein L4 [candidate division Zixibacteria bacterium]
MNVKVYNQNGQEVGAVDLFPEVFDIEPNEKVVHQYIVNYLARQRSGNSSTKVRHDVRGGGAKPWRQKGTGRARAGTTRSPLWRGGGVVFGPHPRSYGSNFPRKMRKLAMKSIFSAKARKNRIKVLDQIEIDEIKTKTVVGMLTKLDVGDKKCIVLDEGVNKRLALSCRNLRQVEYCRATLANGYDVLNADYLIFTKSGLEKTGEMLK